MKKRRPDIRLPLVVLVILLVIVVNNVVAGWGPEVTMVTMAAIALVAKAVEHRW